MIATALRDLRWRVSRLVPVVGCAVLVVAGALLISGHIAQLRHEPVAITAAQGAQAWIAPQDAGGPFSATPQVSVEELAEVRALSDVLRADPVLAVRSTIEVGGTSTDALVLGVETDGLGGIGDVSAGSSSVGAGQVVVSQSADVGLGGAVIVAGETLDVVGVGAQLTAFGGSTVVAINIADAQRLLAGGEAVASMIVIRGEAPDPPAGLSVFDRDATQRDLVQTNDRRIDSLKAIRWLLGAGALALLAGAGWSLARARAGDMALSKRYGITTAQLVGASAAQCGAVALAAIVGGLALGIAIGSTQLVAFRIEGSHLVVAAASIVPLAVIATLAGLRRVASAQPTVPFVGSIAGPANVASGANAAILGGGTK